MALVKTKYKFQNLEKTKIPLYLTGFCTLHVVAIEDHGYLLALWFLNDSESNLQIFAQDGRLVIAKPSSHLIHPCIIRQILGS